MRIVVDTNVLVSGLLWGGPPNQFLKWARDGVLQILACPESLAEAVRVIEYSKFAPRIEALGTSPNQVTAYLMNLVTHAPDPETVASMIPEDPSDDLFHALATNNQARIIVSGDQHLLLLAEHEGIPIVSPAEGVAVIRSLQNA